MQTFATGFDGDNGDRNNDHDHELDESHMLPVEHLLILLMTMTIMILMLLMIKHGMLCEWANIVICDEGPEMCIWGGYRQFHCLVWMEVQVDSEGDSLISGWQIYWHEGDTI